VFGTVKLCAGGLANAEFASNNSMMIRQMPTRQICRGRST
jgi:hypothetical protein